MENWKLSEKKAFQWFKLNIDPNAEKFGEEDSTVGDIYSPLYDTYIEVKDITAGARCGQFTESTIQDNPYAQAIFAGATDLETCKNFIKYHYTKKNVTHFIVVNNDDIVFLSGEEFFENYIFEVQKPYAKRSGTSHAPKKDISALLEHDAEFFLCEDGQVYCFNQNRYGEYISIFNTFDYFISKKNGELRKRSNTQNMTWHLVIKNHI